MFDHCGEHIEARARAADRHKYSERLARLSPFAAKVVIFPEVYEQFVVDEAVQEAFVSGAPASKLREVARKNGFKTLWEIGLSAVQSGLTSPDELVRVAGED